MLVRACKGSRPRRFSGPPSGAAAPPPSPERPERAPESTLDWPAQILLRASLFASGAAFAACAATSSSSFSVDASFAAASSRRPAATSSFASSSAAAVLLRATRVATAWIELRGRLRVVDHERLEPSMAAPAAAFLAVVERERRVRHRDRARRVLRQAHLGEHGLRVAGREVAERHDDRAVIFPGERAIEERASRSRRARARSSPSRRAPPSRGASRPRR